ncbi:MAG TPA: histidine phosphatase family protein [Desulfobulbus sp.]|nr:histidine phosphatase family protein [Desulfobulbus sp.]
MKRLLLCRHAKSSWKDPSLADRDRPLNRRGKRDAPLMGERLAARGIVPDAMVTSPARRARKTAKHLARKLGYPLAGIRIIDAIYGATPAVLLDCIHRFDPAWQQVIMVGHNNEFTLLANMLGRMTIGNVPTAGIVCLDFSVSSWQDVDAGGGSPVFFDYPKKLMTRQE